MDHSERISEQSAFNAATGVRVEHLEARMKALEIRHAESQKALNGNLTRLWDAVNGVREGVKHNAPLWAVSLITAGAAMIGGLVMYVFEHAYLIAK